MPRAHWRQRESSARRFATAKLIYSAITSLDGYVADRDGNFDWAMPDEEVHAFVNELERPVGTYLYGRGMYDVMAAWEHPETLPEQSPLMADYAAIWQAADKIVYSRTLEGVASARTRIEREFDPETVRRMKEAADRDITVGGSELAAQAIAAGLVDEYHLFLNPVVVGGGKRALPDGVRVDLELVDERRFGNGVVHLHYRAA
jgi:dihydrofolate reductase